MSDELPRAPRDDPEAGTGWFAYAPDGASGGEVEDPVIHRVDLRPDEYAGPFWEVGGSLGDDFDELHRWIGISRELFDDLMSWNEEVSGMPGHPLADDTLGLFTHQQDLLRRLAAEVHPGIVVTAPRDAPATLVTLSRLRYDERADRLVDDTGDRSRGLPPVPTALARRVRAWVGERASYATATPENNDAIFAWQDEGDALARELQQALGVDYEVLAR